MPCPACGGRALYVLLTSEQIAQEACWLRDFHCSRTNGDLKDRAEFTQHEAATLTECQACGTLIRNPQPCPESLARRYQRDRYGPETLDQLAAAEDAFYSAKAEALAHQLPAGARILEVGSFVGSFLDAAQRLGWTATGVDIGEETTGYARARGLDVQLADVRDCDFKVSSFDAAFVWNTFDQINEPAETLQCFASILKPGGLLVIRVPNGAFKQVASSRQGERWWMLAQAWNNHLTFPYLFGYNSGSLSKLLSAHGFSVERVAGDTLLPLSDKDTLPEAVHEEQVVKRSVRVHCHTQARTGEPVCHPWMDVFARLAAS